MKATLSTKDIQRLKKKATASGASSKSIKYDDVNEIWKNINKDVTENLNLLWTCSQYWDSLRDARDRSYRAWRYRRGDQWGDIINDPDHKGHKVIEEDYILRQGKPAFKQNIIAQLIRSIVGQYVANPVKSAVTATIRENQVVSEMLTNTLQCALDLNKSRKLDSDNIQQYIMSGYSIGKTSWGWWEDKQRYDGKITNVSPYSFGFNSDVTDPRLLDLWLCFELHDMRIEDIKLNFAKTKDQEEVIDRLYSPQSNSTRTPSDGLDSKKFKNVDLFTCKDNSLCRVIEVWEKKQEWRTEIWDPIDGSFSIEIGEPRDIAKRIEQANKDRIKQANESEIPEEMIPLLEYNEKLESFWYVKYLTPWGQCLFETETPFEHKSHPYTIELAMLNGEVWGLVEEIIDQQRMINRSMIQFDFIISASAKGVLLVPEECIPDDMNINDFAEEWTKFNGVIKYKPKAGIPAPQQVAMNSTNIGLNEFIAMQLNLISQIAGVSPAMQGQEAKSGTPSSLYAQESQNSSMNIKPIFEAFNDYVKNRDSKLLKVLLQFYETGRYIDVNGQSLSEEAKVFNKDMVKNIDFDIKISNTPDTPAYRMLVEERLHDLFINQIIDPDMYLENSSMPYSDKIRQQLKLRSEQADKGQQPQQLDPALMQQIQQGGQQALQALPQNSQNVMNKLLGAGQAQ
jgi:hypothetical protein